MSAFKNKIHKLSQIQKQVAAALPGERIEEIAADLIDCEKQIRRADNPGFTLESLTELGNDMKRDGQHEPAVLRKNPKKPGRFLMVAGERRWRACTMVGIKLQAVVRELSDEQAHRVQRAENIQRENLTQLEIASTLRDDKERLGTLEKVAAEWNKGINWVAERIKFLEVVEADGQASQAVATGVTADISAVNDLHRLEKLSPSAAQAVIERAKADPNTNVRKVVRESLQELKPAAKAKNDNDISRMREHRPATPRTGAVQMEAVALVPEAAQLVALAAQRANKLCTEVTALSQLLQQRPDVLRVLGDALQSIVQAQAELMRTSQALAVLAKTE